MKILFDNGTPRGLARFLVGHDVEEARLHGWAELINGDLIEAAEGANFDLLLTTDKNMRYQQNSEERKISIVVLGNSQWPMVRLSLQAVLSAVNAATVGSYAQVSIPFRESSK